ncbi:MAG: carbohydrate ABC transporter permease [Synergistetes bacterium]|nr:carbohydrate ABC transporter permease [Synergistota bacterium]
MKAKKLKKAVVFAVSILIGLWFLIPVVLITLSAFAVSEDYYNPRLIIPRHFTVSHFYKLFFTLGAGHATMVSLLVAGVTIILSFMLGIPAGYALARYRFRGKDSLKLMVLSTRMFPLMILAIPLLVIFMRLGISDTVLGIALAHTTMVLPFVILITSSIFAGVDVEFEEAAMIFGLSRAKAFFKITLPLALPGLAASAIFAFIMSWNEVFVAAILSLQNRTLPAHILSTAMDSPDYFKFTAGFIMAVPALIFIYFARRYLVSMWGISLK